MNHSNAQLLEIAKGTRLPMQTKLFLAAVVLLIAIGELTPLLTGNFVLLFFVIGSIDYVTRRMNALSQLVFGDDKTNHIRQQDLT